MGQRDGVQLEKKSMPIYLLEESNYWGGERRLASVGGGEKAESLPEPQ